MTQFGTLPSTIDRTEIICRHILLKLFMDLKSIYPWANARIEFLLAQFELVHN